jgi:hypothetical protein
MQDTPRELTTSRHSPRNCSNQGIAAASLTQYWPAPSGVHCSLAPPDVERIPMSGLLPSSDLPGTSRSGEPLSPSQTLTTPAAGATTTSSVASTMLTSASTTRSPIGLSSAVATSSVSNARMDPVLGADPVRSSRRILLELEARISATSSSGCKTNSKFVFTAQCAAVRIHPPSIAIPVHSAASALGR